jgi:CRP-like cAMP-binding protein
MGVRQACEAEIARAFEHPLLGGIGDGARSRLAGRLRFEAVRRREFLSQPRSNASELHLVLDGLLLEVIETYSGQRIVLDVGGPGAALGLPDTAGGADAEPRRRLAALPAEVAALPFDELAEIARGDAVLFGNLLALTYAKARRRSAHLVAMAQSSALARVCHELLAFREYLGISHELSRAAIPCLTHSDLADITRVRRETVTIQLQRLKRLGAVAPCEQGLMLDVGALSAIAEQAECSARVPRPRRAERAPEGDLAGAPLQPVLPGAP